MGPNKGCYFVRKYKDLWRTATVAQTVHVCVRTKFEENGAREGRRSTSGARLVGKSTAFRYASVGEV